LEPIQYKEFAQPASSIVGAGTIIADRYQIIQILGTGGMGTVYLATDSFLGDEPVAIKILHTDYVRNTTQTSRFLREVQLMRRVSQRNVVRTYDVGTAGDLIFFTMEYVSGVSFEKKMDEAPFDNHRVIDYTLQLCDALQTIHEADIIHRDLKPGNILLLEDGTVKLTDFGVARPQRSSLTSHDEIVGSVCYIAPELWLGESATAAVDLYALGVIIYEMCTGEVPFDGDSPIALMRLHLDKIPKPPIELNPHIPTWMNQVILKLLEKKLDNRPCSAEQISEFIKRHLREQENGTAPVPTNAEPVLGSFAEENARKKLNITSSFSKRLISKRNHEVTDREGMPWRIARLSLILAISSILLTLGKVQTALLSTIYFLADRIGIQATVALKALLLPAPSSILALDSSNEMITVAVATCLFVLYLCKEIKQHFYRANPFSRRSHRLVPILLGIAWFVEALTFPRFGHIPRQQLLFIGGAIHYALLAILVIWGTRQRPDLRR
jgi:serine/threonine protein kinase